MPDGNGKRKGGAFFGIHAAAGGVSSTIAAAITCPLEVGGYLDSLNAATVRFSDGPLVASLVRRQPLWRAWFVAMAIFQSKLDSK